MNFNDVLPQRWFHASAISPKGFDRLCVILRPEDVENGCTYVVVAMDYLIICPLLALSDSRMVVDPRSYDCGFLRLSS